MRRRVAIAVATALTFYSLSDLLLWSRIMEANHVNHVPAIEASYATGHRAVLVGLIAVGMILLWDAGGWAVWYGLAVYVLAYSGLCDALFYLLDGRAIPDALPWLNDNRLIPFKPVTQPALIASALLWLAIWGGSLWALAWLLGWVRTARWTWGTFRLGAAAEADAKADDAVAGQTRSTEGGALGDLG